MANKKTTGPESPVTAEQQTGSPGAEAPEVFTIEKLRSEKNVKRAVFAGVCAANGWRPGRAMTEETFLQAVAAFVGAPMGPASGKEARHA